MPIPRKKLWGVKRMKCRSCGYRWVAVFQFGTRVAECANCGIMTATSKPRKDELWASQE